MAGGRLGARAIAKSLYPDLWAKGRETGPGIRFGNLKAPHASSNKAIPANIS